jgi:hypothetical protein
MPGELNQQPKLGHREVDGPALVGDAKGGAVDFERSEMEGGAGVIGHCPSQGGSHSGEELRAVKRLRHVVVRAGFEPGDDVVGVGPGRQDHDRNPRHPPYLTADGEPVHRWQHQIQNHDVEVVSSEYLQRLSAVSDADDVHPGPLKQQARCLLHRHVVLDEEDVPTHHPKPISRRRANGTAVVATTPPSAGRKSAPPRKRPWSRGPTVTGSLGLVLALVPTRYGIVTELLRHSSRLTMSRDCPACAQGGPHWEHDWCPWSHRRSPRCSSPAARGLTRATTRHLQAKRRVVGRPSRRAASTRRATRAGESSGTPRCFAMTRAPM